MRSSAIQSRETTRDKRLEGVVLVGDELRGDGIELG